ncbi:hypothetical protein QE152_g19194 [Popillia japonica]|uniref:Uncharacterized protein n=1 Tax=Popillia japonica TaxID=7064 RepID=A0AAW1KXW2_POPJA
MYVGSVVFNFQDREDDKDNAIKKKTDYAMNNLTLGELSLICNVLGELSLICNVLGMDNNANNKEELIDFLCKKLNDVSVITEKDVSNNDDDGEENVNTLVKSKGDSEDGIEHLNDVHGASGIGIVESHSRSQKTTPKFMMTFKDVEETVTTYDGGDTYPINRWISEFEEIATLMDWHDVEKLIYGKRLLKGEALLFVRSERGITSWEILKTKLRNEFSKSVNSATLHKTLLTRKKRDETLQQYLLNCIPCILADRKSGKQESLLNPTLQQYLLNCIPCILADRKSGKQESLLNPIDKGEVPLQIYHVDHLGPMTQTGKVPVRCSGCIFKICMVIPHENHFH